jgi:hypothetical protein
MPTKKAAVPKKKSTTSKAAAKKNLPIKNGELNNIIPELQKIVNDIENFGKTKIIATGDNAKKLRPSFKDDIHDTIVAHEMLNTKRRVEIELQNCGDVFYITEEEAAKIENHYKNTIKQMAVDALIIGVGCFILGVFYGRKQIVDYIENHLLGE